jgi:hypothetical protein
VGGGFCTDLWRSHNFETLRKTAEHTCALFLLVGINPDCEAEGPRIGIETNLKSRIDYGAGEEKGELLIKKFGGSFGDWHGHLTGKIYPHLPSCKRSNIRQPLVWC